MVYLDDCRKQCDNSNACEVFDYIVPNSIDVPYNSGFNWITSSLSLTSKSPASCEEFCGNSCSSFHFCKTGHPSTLLTSSRNEYYFPGEMKNAEMVFEVYKNSDQGNIVLVDYIRVENWAHGVKVTIETSIDGTNWDFFGSGNHASSNRVYVHNPAQSRIAKFIRLKVTSTVVNNKWGLRTFQVYGSLVAASKLSTCRLYKAAECKELVSDETMLHSIFRKFPRVGGAFTKSLVNYTCLNLHEPESGDSVRACKNDGSWSGEPLRCRPIPQCRESLLADIGHNTRPSGSYTFEPSQGICVNAYPGESCLLQCDHGYERVSGDFARTCGKDGLWLGDPLKCAPVKEGLCTMDNDVTPFASRIEDGTSAFATSMGNLTQAPYPPNKILNCTRVIDVTCQGWFITFVPYKIDLAPDVDFLYVYDGDTLDPSKRLAIFATGDPKPYFGFTGSNRTDFTSVTTSQPKMTLHFVTSGNAHNFHTAHYGFEGMYYTGTYDYIQCVLKNVENFENCQVAGNGITEGTEECDDGNFANGDGCSSDMKIETRKCISDLEYELSPPEFGCIGGDRVLTKDRECRLLTQCVLGETYQNAPPSKTSDRSCKPVQKCASFNEYMLFKPTLTLDSVCRNASVCNTTTQFELVPLGANNDRICVEATKCGQNEYEVRALALTADRVCKPHTVCVLGIISQGNGTHDALCKEHMTIYVIDLDGKRRPLYITSIETLSVLVDKIAVLGGISKSDVLFKNQSTLINGDPASTLLELGIAEQEELQLVYQIRIQTAEKNADCILADLKPYDDISLLRDRASACAGIPTEYLNLTIGLTLVGREALKISDTLVRNNDTLTAFAWYPPTGAPTEVPTRIEAPTIPIVTIPFTPYQVFTIKVKGLCENSQKDGIESDVDCGGKICPACDEGEACSVNSDCADMLFCDANNTCSNSSSAWAASKVETVAVTAASAAAGTIAVAVVVFSATSTSTTATTIAVSSTPGTTATPALVMQVQLINLLGQVAQIQDSSPSFVELGEPLKWATLRFSTEEVFCTVSLLVIFIVCCALSFLIILRLLIGGKNSRKVVAYVLLTIFAACAGITAYYEFYLDQSEWPFHCADVVGYLPTENSTISRRRRLYAEPLDISDDPWVGVGESGNSSDFEDIIIDSGGDPAAFFVGNLALATMIMTLFVFIHYFLHTFAHSGSSTPHHTGSMKHFISTKLVGQHTFPRWELAACVLFYNGLSESSARALIIGDGGIKIIALVLVLILLGVSTWTIYFVKKNVVDKRKAIYNADAKNGKMQMALRVSASSLDLSLLLGAVT